MKFRNHSDRLLSGTLSLFILATMCSGEPANPDELGRAPGSSEFSHNYDGRLATVIKEDHVLEVFKVRGYPIFYIEFANASPRRTKNLPLPR